MIDIQNYILIGEVFSHVTNFDIEMLYIPNPKPKGYLIAGRPIDASELSLLFGLSPSAGKGGW